MLASKETFTVGEVALLHDVPLRTIYRAVRAGDLVAMYYNRRTVRIQRPALVAYTALCQARAVNPSLSGPNATSRTKGR